MNTLHCPSVHYSCYVIISSWNIFEEHVVFASKNKNKIFSPQLNIGKDLITRVLIILEIIII